MTLGVCRRHELVAWMRNQGAVMRENGRYDGDGCARDPRGQRLGYRVRELGSRVSGFGFRFRASGLGFRVSDSGFRCELGCGA